MSPIDYSKRPSSPPPAAAGGSPVSLSKLSLTKQGERVDLTKGGGGDIRVNLNWNQGSGQKKGLFRKGGGIDLDLGCLFEFESGDKGGVQALGNNFGSLTSPPWIHLDADDRTGQVSGGENMTISGNPGIPFRRILVFAFIYEGVPNWAQADAVVTLTPPSGPQVEVRLDEHSGLGTCAIALLEATSGGGLSVSRQVRYFGDMRQADEHYNWGLQWRSGRK